MVEIKKEDFYKEIGFHQGALNTLINERSELIRITKQVESIMEVHIKKLEELGVKIEINKDNKEE